MTETASPAGNTGAPADPTLLGRLTACADRKEWQSLEELWLQAAESEPAALAGALPLVQTLADATEPGRGLALIQLALEPLRKSGRHAAVLGAARWGAPHAPRDLELRNAALEAYRRLFTDRPELESILNGTGLAAFAELPAALTATDKLLSVPVGTLLFHENGWGLGRVTGIEADHGILIADFEGHRGARVPLDALGQYVKRLPDHDFRVRVRRDLEALRTEARERPVEFFLGLLSTFGDGVGLKELKPALIPDVIAEGEWSRWWTKAKTALRRSGQIDLTDGNFPVFSRRVGGESPEQLEADDLARIRKPAELLTRGLTLVKQADGHPLAPVIREALGQALGRVLKPHLPEAYGLCCMAEAALGAPEPGSWETPEQCLKRLAAEGPGAIGPALAASPAAAQRRALAWLRTHAGAAWPALFESVLDTAADAVGEDVLRVLADAVPSPEVPAQRLAALAHRLLEHAADRPEPFMAYYRAAQRSPALVEAARGAHKSLWERMLELCDMLGAEFQRTPKPAVRARLHQARATLAVQGYADFKDLLKAGDDETARKIYSLVRQSRGLSDPAREVLLDLVGLHHPDVIQLRTAAAARIGAGPVLVTAAGFRKKQEEFQKLVNEEMAENSRDIGRAMEFGDLSENSEFTAAIEKQGFLATKATQMKADLDNAKILNPASVDPSKVVPGTRVELEEQGSRTREHFSLLGPWDSDVDRGIISYLSPLGQAMTGKLPGDEVIFDHEGQTHRYRVIKIERADF